MNRCFVLSQVESSCESLSTPLVITHPPGCSLRRRFGPIDQGLNITSPERLRWIRALARDSVGRSSTSRIDRRSTSVTWISTKTNKDTNRFFFINFYFRNFILRNRDYWWTHRHTGLTCGEPDIPNEGRRWDMGWSNLPTEEEGLTDCGKAWWWLSSWRNPDSWFRSAWSNAKLW